MCIRDRSMAESNFRCETIGKLKRVIESFEKNKEWADLVSWLSKLNEALRNPSLEQIPSEEILAKRLCTILTTPSTVLESVIACCCSYSCDRNLLLHIPTPFQVVEGIGIGKCIGLL
eukprot:TRINITY_DN16966_c0_g1_i2.p3 TRINITY_DN16966_c0_g1~~TRINITY_DN16966_c0_g1_i2.p3  ORF type:complete len:117 (+),score=3.85 TRINITY_DN16966_c0_g1_i2:78-428(+)